MLNLKKIDKKNYSLVEIDFLDVFKKDANPSHEFLEKTASSEVCYNVKLDKNMLKDGFGLTELVLPETRLTSDVYEKKLSYPGSISFKKVWRYKYYSQFNSRYEYVLLMFASDGKVYYNNIFSINTNLYSVGNFTFSEEPTLIEFRLNGADCVGFATSTDDLVVWNCDSAPYKVDDSVKFRSICQSNGRLFAIEDGANYVVRYSNTLNPTVWTSSDSSGFYRVDLEDFRGELRKLVGLLDNMYVFRDFGISKIYSSNSSVSASNIYNSSCKIYPKTICVCNDNIFFLTEDGLYKFDGYKVTHVDLGIFENFKKFLQTDATTCFHEGKLYIACYLNFSGEDEEVKNNSVIIYDVLENSSSVVYGVSVSSMLSFKDLNASKLMFTTFDDNKKFKLWEMCEGKNSDDTLNKFFSSNTFYVEDEDSKKILKYIKVLSLEDLNLTVKTDAGIKSFAVKGSEKAQKIYLDVVGKHFKIVLSSSEKEFCVKHLKFGFKVAKA